MAFFVFKCERILFHQLRNNLLQVGTKHTPHIPFIKHGHEIMQFHLTVGHANKVNHLQTKLVKDGTSRLLVDGVDDAKASELNSTLQRRP